MTDMVDVDANVKHEVAAGAVETTVTAEQRAAMLAQIKKAINTKRGMPPDVKEQNKRTAAAALECASVGLQVVDVHSIGADGECTCQYNWEKRLAQGKSVPPCTGKDRGKHPKGFAWQKTATSDMSHIAARWGDAYGALNVGVVFGGKTGVVLIEGDGEAGAATVLDWQGNKGLPQTVTVVSGSGGTHLYFRVPAGWDIRNSVKKIGPGMDVRGEHGFSVGPGSRHVAGIASQWKDGEGVYGWLEGHGPDDGMKIADAPEWLLRKLWFATKDRRHMTAPDGSKFEDSGLPEWEEETKAAPGAASGAEVDPFAAAGREMGGGNGAGWEAKVALIGHGPELSGNFNDQIYSAALSYFGRHGVDADAEALLTALYARIEVAPEDTPGHRDTYLPPSDKTENQVEAARTSLRAKGVEPVRRATPEANGFEWPTGYLPEREHLCYQRKTDAGAWVSVPMCSLFEVLGWTANETGQEDYGLLIRFTDKFGTVRVTNLLDADIRSDTGALIAKLAGIGFWIDNTAEAKAKFLACLGRVKSSGRITVAARPGWHGKTFVTPYGEAIGADPTMRLADGNTLPGAERCAGTLEGWQNQAADLMVMLDAHGPVVLCSAFAGVLVDLLGHDTAGIAITGESSRGKSIAQKFAATVWSDPRPKRGLFIAARSSANGLEPVLEWGNGTTLQIDELKGMRAEQLGEIIMTLASGVSKNRANADMTARRDLRWTTFFTMSAEESVREIIESSRQSYVSGYGVRAVEIDTTDAAKFEIPEWVEHLKGDIGKHWGWAGPKFVRYLHFAGYVEHPERLIERLDDARAWLLAGAPGGGTQGRAAGVLAYALVAGEIAQEAGIIPVEERALVPAGDGILRTAFRKAWLSSWGSPESTPENSPETAFARFQGQVAQEWHLRTFDQMKFEAAQTFAEEDRRPGDGEPRLAKWFHVGPKLTMMVGGVEVEYVAVTQEAFNHMVKGCGVKASAILKWAHKKGLLFARDAEHLSFGKLPGYGAVGNYRFKVGAIGPGGEAGE